MNLPLLYLPSSWLSAHFLPPRFSPAQYLLAIVSFALLSVGAVDAQLAPLGGSVSGKVLDRDGNPIAEAQVLIVGERKFRTHTDRWGYRFEHLPSGKYTVEASALGFITALVEKVDVRLGDSLRIDFRLKAGKPNAVSFTTMPIIDTTTAGAAYRLFDPPIGSLPLSGTLAGIERLLPQESELVSTTSLYIDGGEVLPEMALDFSIWRPAVGRLASELFETADLFGSRLDPRVRTLDSLQLLTRSAAAQWHGRFGLRYSADELGGNDQPGSSERFDQERPYAALAVPVAPRFRLFAGLADHRSRARPLDLDGNFEPEALRGVRARRSDDSTFFRLNGGPLGPNLDLSASFLELDSSERGDRGSGGNAFARFETSVRRGLVRLNRFSGRFGTVAQFNDRRATTAIDDFETRRVRTKDVALSVDSLISRHAMTLGISREKTSGDLLAAPLDRRPVGGASGISDLSLERINVSLSDHWRATENLAVQVGMRVEQLTWTERHSFRGPPGESERDDEAWLLPRIGLAWDVFGNGEWALLVSGGSELVRQVAIFGQGLQPFLDLGLAPTDRVEVEAVSVSSRYQLFPGLIVDSELGRRRFSGNESEALRPLAEEESRIRFGAEARIGKRWLARGLYELRDLGLVTPGLAQQALPVELGTTQRTHFHVVRNFDRGWVLSGVYEYIDEYNVAMRALGVVTEVPLEQTVAPASLSQLDLMVEYRWGNLPKLPLFGSRGSGGKAPKFTWRVEILNLFDSHTEPVAIPGVFQGAGSEGLLPFPTLSSNALSAAGFSPLGDLVPATQQQGRRIWLGFGVEL